MSRAPLYIFSVAGQTPLVPKIYVWRRFFMEAIVLQKACIQCGLCTSVCPEVFSIAPGEPAQAIVGPVPDDLRLAVQEAADACPVAAIEVR